LSTVLAKLIKESIMVQSVRAFLLCCILVFFISIIILLRNRKIDLKYSLLWLLSAIVLIVATLFPQIIYFLSALIGIETPINLVLIFTGMFSVLIILSLTVIVSKLNKKITELVQSLALLEKRVRDMENKL